MRWNPAARRVHLLAPELIGRTRGQAEAAVHAVIDDLAQLASRVKLVGVHQIPPANRPGDSRRFGSNCSFTDRISASEGTGPKRST